MRNHPAIALAFILALAGCKHENPLKDTAVSELSSWVYQHRTPEIISCAKEWAAINPSQEKFQSSPTCQPVANKLAASFKDAGFGDVYPEDVLLPTLWTNFNERIRADKANSYDAKKTRGIFGDIPTAKEKRVP